MASKFTSFLESFIAGETTPLIRGRIDTRIPSRGCRSLENFYVIPQGGIRRREGTLLVAETKDSTQKSRLVPFVISANETWILEVGPGYMRAFSSGASEDGSIPKDSGDGSGGGSTSGTPEQILDSPWENDSFTTDLSSWTPDSATTDPTINGTSWVADLNGSVWMSMTTNTPSLGSAYVQYYQQYDPIAAGNYIFEIDYRVSITNGGAAESPFIYFYDGDPTGAGSQELVIYDDLPKSNDGSLQSVALNITLPAIADPYILVYTQTNDEDGTNYQYTIGKVRIRHEPLEATTSRITEDNLNEIEFTQGPDGILYASHVDFPPLEIRAGAGGLSITEFTATDGPYFDKEHAKYGGIGSNKTVTTAGGAAGATGVTITFSSAVLDPVGDIGRLVRIRPNDSSAWGNGTITSVTSPTVGVITVNSAIANTTTSLEWRLGSWSPGTGYPRASTFHQQRLVYGGTIYEPQTVWGSYASQFDNFAPDDGSADEFITDLTAYNFELATDEPELIQWLISKEDLVIGTNRQIHRAFASNFGELFSALNVNIQAILKSGCSQVPPVVIGDKIIYSHLYRRGLMQASPRNYSKELEAINLMTQADHLADKSPIISAGWQQYPYSIFYFGTDDGTLLTLTYREDIGTLAWSRQILGGDFGGDNPVIESIARVVGDVQDDIWMIVKRTVNGSTIRTVELMSDAVTPNTTRTSQIHLDAAIQATVVIDAADSNVQKFQVQNVNIFDGVGSTSRPALFEHLEGETVGVVVNGVYLGTDTITSGQPVTYPATALTAGDNVVIGLLYTSTAETNTVEPITNVGSAPGYDMRLYEVNVRLHNSLKGELGFDSSNLDPLQYPTSIDPTDEASEMFTGDIKVKFPHGWDRDNRIMIKQTEPYPLTVTLLGLKMITGNA